MSEAQAHPGQRRGGASGGLLFLLKIVCAACAIASLPPGRIHPLWLLTFIWPAALFLYLGTGRFGKSWPTWVSFLVAALCQAGCAYLAWFHLGPLNEKNSLACSLLPALTFFTLRREPADTSLSLFLSFCFLLIGIMLNQDSADWTLLLFLGTCTYALQIEASNRAKLLRHAAAGKPMPVTTKLLRRSQVVLALMVVAFLGYFGMDLIPSLGEGESRRRQSTRLPENRRVIGLDSRFDLSGAGGSPLSVTADRILSVRAPEQESVPRDLYLRMTFFDRPGVDEWRTWPFNFRIQEVDPEHFWCREAIPGLKKKNLAVTRLVESGQGELYMPPGVVGLSGVVRLQYDLHVGYYRSHAGGKTYGLLYQRPHKARRVEAIDPGSTMSGRFTELPAELESDRLRRLARDLAGSAPEDLPPMQLAHRLAEGLQQRCKYALREPAGDFADPLHRFLFGSSREGYCMHFATALAVMLRLQKIPCRIAVGFHAGQPGLEGRRVFGSQHAHAWVELPLERVGWTLVDPTPPADRVRRGWPEPAPAGLPEPMPDEAPAAGGSCFLIGILPFLEEPLEILCNPLEKPGAFLTLTGLFVALTLALLTLVAGRGRRSRDAPATARPTPDSVRARRLLNQILTVLARRGYERQHRATLEQYLGGLRFREVGVDLPVLDRAFNAYQEVRFGNRPLDPTRLDRFAAGLATVEELEPEST